MENERKLAKILGEEVYDPVIEDARAILDEYPDSDIKYQDSSTTFQINSITSLDDLLSREFPPVEWLVNKLVPDKGLVALSGLPGSYKSWITQHLALAVSTGTPLFDNFTTQQGNVLIIDKENYLSLVQKRFKLLGALPGLGIYFWEKEFFIEDEEMIKEICDFIKQKKIRLVIMDSLIRIYRNKDENSSNDIAEVFRQLRRFQEVEAAIIFTHHHRKQSIMGKNIAAESMRGSSDILASVDCHLSVDKTEEGVKITQTKLRQDMAIKPFKVRIDSEESRVEFIYCGETEEAKEKVEQAKEDIYQVLEEGELTRADLIERFKGVYGSKTIDETLKSFSNEEVVIRVGERGKRFYRRAGSEIEGTLFNSE